MYSWACVGLRHKYNMSSPGSTRNSERWPASSAFQYMHCSLKRVVTGVPGSGHSWSYTSLYIVSKYLLWRV